MSDTQSFNVDFFNNTSRTVFVEITGNEFITGAFGSWTLQPQAFASGQNNNLPFLMTLNDNPAGQLNFSVQLVIDGIPAGGAGNYVLTLDGAPLTSIPGVAYFLGAASLERCLSTSDGFIFPLVYINLLFQGNDAVVLMLVDAAGSIPNLNTPYGVG